MCMFPCVYVCRIQQTESSLCAYLTYGLAKLEFEMTRQTYTLMGYSLLCPDIVQITMFQGLVANTHTKAD